MAVSSIAEVEFGTELPVTQPDPAFIGLAVIFKDSGEYTLHP